MEKLPEFSLKNQRGESVTSEDFKGRTTILYFYPRDNTPACTTQAVDFTEHLEELTAEGVQVFGINGDSARKHQNFIEKHNIGFDLLVDEQYELASQLGIYRLKKVFGRETMGLVRTTLVIDPELNIKARFDEVKVGQQWDEIRQVLEMK